MRGDRRPGVKLSLEHQSAVHSLPRRRVGKRRLSAASRRGTSRCECLAYFGSRDSWDAHFGMPILLSIGECQ
jgi:hypothetical protein